MNAAALERLKLLKTRRQQISDLIQTAKLTHRVEVNKLADWLSQVDQEIHRLTKLLRADGFEVVDGK